MVRKEKNRRKEKEKIRKRDKKKKTEEKEKAQAEGLEAETANLPSQEEGEEKFKISQKNRKVQKDILFFFSSAKKAALNALFPRGTPPQCVKIAKLLLSIQK